MTNYPSTLEPLCWPLLSSGWPFLSSVFLNLVFRARGLPATSVAYVANSLTVNNLSWILLHIRLLELLPNRKRLTAAFHTSSQLHSWHRQYQYPWRHPLRSCVAHVKNPHHLEP